MDLALPWSPPDMETKEKLPYKALKGNTSNLLFPEAGSIGIPMDPFREMRLRPRKKPIRGYKGLYTPLSESRSGLGGLSEDLGRISGVLGVMVSTIREPLKNQSDSSVQNLKIIENGRDTAISVFGFRSTFNEGSVEGH